MKKILFILILAAFILLARPVLAADLGPILPECASTGRCSLCDIIQTVVNFGEFLFGIVGALVLLYFCYGGLLMLISGGAGEKVKKGKDVLVNSVIGLLIVFLAYSGVNFLITAVTKQGWTWTGNLSCAPLPGPTNWNAPPPGQGAGGGQTGSAWQPGNITPGTQGATGACTLDPNTHCINNKCITCAFCGSDGICKQRKVEGEACVATETKGGQANDVCVLPLVCEGGKCTQHRSAEGTVCTTDDCGAAMFCEKQANGSGLCKPRLADGSICHVGDINNMTNDTPLTSYSLGAADLEKKCLNDSYCQNITFKCKKKGSIGERCGATTFVTTTDCPIDVHGPAGGGDAQASADHTCLSGKCGGTYDINAKPCGTCQ